MTRSPERFEVAVCITHEPTDDGPRPMLRPFRAAFECATREEAEQKVKQFFAAAAETGLQPYTVTHITPVRALSPVAGEILPGGGAILGETLADVLNLDTWTQTRFITTRKADREGRQEPLDR